MAVIKPIPPPPPSNLSLPTPHHHQILGFWEGNDSKYLQPCCGMTEVGLLGGIRQGMRDNIWYYTYTGSNFVWQFV